MIEMSSQIQDGLEYEIVDRRARSTLSYLLDNIATTYGITAAFSFVESSNDLLLVIAGKEYVTTLSAYEGYMLDPASVKVTMAGVDVTALYYRDGVLSIPAVKGDIVITASAVEEEAGGGEGEEPAVYYTIEKRLYNVTMDDGGVSSVIAGGEYTGTPKADDGYELYSVQVNMGGADIGNEVYQNGVITIPEVTAKVIITVTAIQVEAEEPTVFYSVTGTLTNCELDPSLDEVNSIPDGTGYSALLTAQTGYAFGDGAVKVYVTQDGEKTDVTSLCFVRKVYDEVTGLLTGGTVLFTIVPGDVEIQAAASITHTITQNLSANITPSNTDIAVPSGSGYELTLTPDDDYALMDVSVTVDGSDVTETVYSVDGLGIGTVKIDTVLGDVVITATAVQTSAKTWTVEHKLTNVYASISEGTVNDGTNYYAVLYAMNNCKMSSVTVTMGGLDISDCYEGGETSGAVTIPAVTGDVVITAVAESTVYTYSVTMNDEAVIFTQETEGTDNVIQPGAEFGAVVAPKTGYGIRSVTLTMGGEDVSAYASKTTYDDTWLILISEVTGNIEIEIEETTTWNVTYHVSDGAEVQGESTVNAGGYLVATWNPVSDDYVITSVEVTMAGHTLDGVVDTNALYIQEVWGDVEITVTAKPLTEMTYPVVNTLTNVTNSNTLTAVSGGSSYTATLTADTGYLLDPDSVKIRMGGVDITDNEGVYGDGMIYIARVTGWIGIEASAVEESS